MSIVYGKIRDCIPYNEERSILKKNSRANGDDADVDRERLLPLLPDHVVLHLCNDPVHPVVPVRRVDRAVAENARD